MCCVRSVVAFIVIVRSQGPLQPSPLHPNLIHSSSEDVQPHLDYVSRKFVNVTRKLGNVWRRIRPFWARGVLYSSEGKLQAIYGGV